MTINNGTIQSINKKLIASLLAVTLVTSMSGCKKDDVRWIDYTKDKNGNVISNDTISYFYITNVKVVGFKEGEQEFVRLTSLGLQYSKDGSERKTYRDIFGGEILYDTIDPSSDREIVKEEALIDYLLQYDKVQQEYTEAELRNILNMIKEDYKSQIKNK